MARTPSIRVSIAALALFAVATSSAPAAASGTPSGDHARFVVIGNCPGPQPVSFEVSVDFVPTGPGAATVHFTLENTSGVYPFQVPAIGNPVLTGFFLNLPSGAGVTYTEARILAGGSVVSNGGSIDAVPVPAGCTALPADLVRTEWYELITGQATGQFGILSVGPSTDEGIKAGLVDPDVFDGCEPLGDVFSPIFVAGRVRFRFELTGLPAAFDSAQDFDGLCSLVHGAKQPTSFAGKFQGTGYDGEESCFAGRACLPTPAARSTWGRLKSAYR